MQILETKNKDKRKKIPNKNMQRWEELIFMIKVKKKNKKLG